MCFVSPLFFIGDRPRFPSLGATHAAICRWIHLTSEEMPSTWPAMRSSSRLKYSLGFGTRLGASLSECSVVSSWKWLGTLLAFSCTITRTHLSCKLIFYVTSSYSTGNPALTSRGSQVFSLSYHRAGLFQRRHLPMPSPHHRGLRKPPLALSSTNIHHHLHGFRLYRPCFSSVRGGNTWAPGSGHDGHGPGHYPDRTGGAPDWHCRICDIGCGIRN